jgi:hypothetical protein
MTIPRYATLLLSGLALSACVSEAPQTGVQPNYQAPVARLSPPANLQSVCSPIPTWWPSAPAWCSRN